MGRAGIERKENPIMTLSDALEVAKDDADFEWDVYLDMRDDDCYSQQAIRAQRIRAELYRQHYERDFDEGETREH